MSVCLLLLTAGCSREQQDWRSAEAADSIDSYGEFIQRHPESELVTQARARVAQLGEDRDWQRAGSVDTVDAYREFMAQHPNGKWAQEAHIRIENFSLGEQAGAEPGTSPVAASSPGAASAPVPASSSVAASPPAAASSPAAVSPPPAVSSAAVESASSAPAAPVSGFAYGIQLGAFSTEAGASAQWESLSTRYASQLEGLAQHIVPADSVSGRIYRLQATVGDESRARSICEQLKSSGQACVAVLPH